jgi:hypothetical protein
MKTSFYGPYHKYVHFLPPLPEDDASSLHRQQTPPAPFIPQDDTSKQNDADLGQSHLPSTPHIQPKSHSIFVSSPAVQSQAPAPVHNEEEDSEEEQKKEEKVSIHQSPIIALNKDSVTPSAVPYRDPSYPQHPQYQCSNLQINWHKAVVDFLFMTIPEQVYLLLLLRLPALYFSRVARIFEEANLSLPEIKQMVLETASQGLTHEYEFQMALEREPCCIPPAYKRLTSTWGSFINSLMREWKTFNIVSALLLTYVLPLPVISSSQPDFRIGAF